MLEKQEYRRIYKEKQ